MATKFVEPEDGELAECVHCGAVIIYLVTSIDNFWTHRFGGKGRCADSTQWASPKNIPEPDPIYLKMQVWTPEEPEWKEVKSE